MLLEFKMVLKTSFTVYVFFQIQCLILLLCISMRRQSNILTLLFLLVALVGCKKQSNTNNIPNVAVNEFVYLNNPSSFNLQVQGGWVYNNGGYAGLIVYRRYFNQQYDDFAAYDLACPVHFQQSCGTLKVVSDIYLECPCSGHQYLLFDGLPLAGDSPQLRFYNTQFDGFNIIHISN